MTEAARDLRAPAIRPSHPGGITAACGCRYVRTGGWWYQVTPCHAHVLSEWPVTDEHMIEALQPSQQYQPSEQPRRNQ